MFNEWSLGIVAIICLTVLITGLIPKRNKEDMDYYHYNEINTKLDLIIKEIKK